MVIILYHCYLFYIKISYSELLTIHKHLLSTESAKNETRPLLIHTPAPAKHTLVSLS